MSVLEIIEELPKLSQAERAAIAARLRDLEERECIELCNAAAEAGAKLLDDMEQQDNAQRATR